MIGSTNTGGGDLNMLLVYGASQPEHPVNNLIWVNTDVAIPHFYVQHSQPSLPATGDVWLTWRATSDAVINISRTDDVEFALGTCKQYLNDAWVDKTASIFKNGAWLTATSGGLKLWTGTGKIWNDFASNRNVYASADNTYSEHSGYFEISKINSNSCYLRIFNIDATGARTIRFDVQTFNTGSYYPNYSVRVFQNGTRFANINFTSWTTRQWASVDIASRIGNIDIQIGHYGTSGQASSGYMRCYNIEVI